MGIKMEQTNITTFHLTMVYQTKTIIFLNIIQTKTIKTEIIL
jgi:hypothetical protein